MRRAPVAFVVLSVFLAACGSGTGATLDVIDTAIDVRHGATGAFQSGKNGATLAIGETVRTDDKGFGTLNWFSGALTRLDVNTTFTLLGLTRKTPRTAKLRLDVGRSWNRVGKLTKGERFQITTPVAVATVRGTQFAVSCDTTTGPCIVDVLQGVVRVKPNNADAIDVPAETELRVGTDGKPIPIPQPPPKKGQPAPPPTFLRTVNAADLQGIRFFQRNLALDTNQPDPGPQIATPAPAPTAAPAARPAPTPTPSPKPAAPQPAAVPSSYDPGGYGWGTDAQQYAFNAQSGKQGEFGCPPNGVPSNVSGTDVYPTNSRVCSSAVHAGRITKASGGMVVIEIRPGQDSYQGSTRNGVTSQNTSKWSSSYVFVTSTPYRAGPQPGGTGWTQQAGTYRNYQNQQFVYSCPPNGTAQAGTYVTGTGVYADDSSVCTAGVHAGRITFAQGGRVTIEIRPAQDSYQGSTANGVTSRSYGKRFGSFVIVA